MRLRWTSKAFADIARLYAFLASVNPRAAAAVVQKLTAAPLVLLTQAKIGTPVPEFAPRDVRPLILLACQALAGRPIRGTAAASAMYSTTPMLWGDEQIARAHVAQGPAFDHRLPAYATEVRVARRITTN